MLKNIMKKRPFISGIIVGVFGIGILGGYLKKKIGHRVVIITAVIDKEELPEDPNMGDPEKENIGDPTLEKKEN